MSARIFDLVRRDADVRQLVDGKLTTSSPHRPIPHDPLVHGRYIIDGPALDLRRTPSQTPLQARRSGANISLPCDPAWFEFVSRTGNTRLAAVARSKSGRDVAREATARGEALRRFLTNTPALNPRGLSTITFDVYASPTVSASSAAIECAWSILVILDPDDVYLGSRLYPNAGWSDDGGDVPPDNESHMLGEVTAAVVYALWLMGNGLADFKPVLGGPGGLDAVEVTEAVVITERRRP